MSRAGLINCFLMQYLFYEVPQQLPERATSRPCKAALGENCSHHTAEEVLCAPRPEAPL